MKSRCRSAFMCACASAAVLCATTHAPADVTLFADLTGDGIAESIVGQPTGVGMALSAGRVIVYDGVSGAAMLFIAGDSTGDEFGASVALLHDQNHDGLSELAVGAPGASTNGAAFVFRSPLPTEYAVISAENAEFELHAPDLEESLGVHRVLARFGETVAAFYDMDGDGAAEFRVGCYEIDTTDGSIRHAAGIFEGQIGVQIAHAVVTVDPDSQLTDPLAGLRCDVGKDGAVAIDDVLAVVERLGNEEFSDADIDGDGNVTAVDLLAVAFDVGKQSLGLIPDGPREVGDSIFGTWTRSILRDDGVQATAMTVGTGIIAGYIDVSAELGMSGSTGPTFGGCFANLDTTCPQLAAAMQAVQSSCSAAAGMPAGFQIPVLCAPPPQFEEDDPSDERPRGRVTPNCRVQTIAVWIDPSVPAAEQCKLLAHELWHVAQTCAMGFFTPGNCKNFWDRWYAEMSCMEWFAYNQTGTITSQAEFCDHLCNYYFKPPNPPNCRPDCLSELANCVPPGVFQ